MKVSEAEAEKMLRKPWIRMQSVTTVIGIDPGTNIGLAVYGVSDKKLTQLHTFDFWGAYDHVIHGYKPKETKIVIEISTKTHVWGGKLQHKNAAAAAKVGQSVAVPKVMGVLLADRLEAFGFLVERKNPSNTKIKADAFKRLTGWVGRSNEHERDAAMMVVGH